MLRTILIMIALLPFDELTSMELINNDDVMIKRIYRDIFLQVEKRSICYQVDSSIITAISRNISDIKSSCDLSTMILPPCRYKKPISPHAKEALAAVGASIYAYKTKDFWARLFSEGKTTTTTKSPLAVHSNKTTRLKQNNSSESSVQAARARPSSSYLRRDKRALGLLIRAAPHVGNFIKWTSVLSATSVAGSVATHYLNEKENVKLTRKLINCKEANFGCMSGLCWANCGPRLFSADWCFTTKNVTELSAVFCAQNAECDPCLQCGSTCHMELGTGAGLPPGTITPETDIRKKHD